MKKIWTGLLVLAICFFAAAGCAFAEGKPAGGLEGREIPAETSVEEQNWIQRLFRILRSGDSYIDGPTSCVTGQTYTWTYKDQTGSAANNWYEMMMTVQDGTYKNPNTSDVQYAPARSQSRTLTYTFYIPGTYYIFTDVYPSESSEESIKTDFKKITVTDGGANELTRKVASVVAEYRPAGGDDFDTVLALHDWVLDHCTYDDTYTWYSAESLLLHGTGVCNSYTRALKLLLAQAGIPCKRVAGYAWGKPENGHAWNAVQIHGKWYLLDATWDDSSDTQDAFLRHQYFAVNSDLMDIEHTAQYYTDGGTPECNSLDDNWLLNMDHWQIYADSMLAEFSQALAAGKHRFTLNAPEYRPDQYTREMQGTVTALGMTRTAWPYGTGKTLTGTFEYNATSGKITGKDNDLRELRLPADLTTIEDSSFENIGANVIIIGKNCAYIGHEAFAGKDIDIWEIKVEGQPETGMTIEEDAFAATLTDVYVIASPGTAMADYAAGREAQGWTVSWPE